VYSEGKEFSSTYELKEKLCINKRKPDKTSVERC
jgi:hypothetical protein